MKYDDIDGEWQNNLGNGWKRFTPRGDVISKEISLFGNQVWIGERSCIIRSDTKFSTKSSEEVDKLSIETTGEI